MKHVMSRWRSQEKFKFLVAQESMHSIETRRLNSLIMKLDLVKSYDHVNWDFLRLVLLQVGLSVEAINWVMGCVSSSNFVVIVNGEPTKFFKSSRGLRQGCPLSPLLFLFIVEGLSRLIQNVRREGNIKGIKVTQLIRITHLLFVDDVNFLVRELKRNAIPIKLF